MSLFVQETSLGRRSCSRGVELPPTVVVNSSQRGVCLFGQRWYPRVEKVVKHFTGAKARTEFPRAGQTYSGQESARFFGGRLVDRFAICDRAQENLTETMQFVVVGHHFNQIKLLNRPRCFMLYFASQIRCVEPSSGKRGVFFHDTSRCNYF